MPKRTDLKKILVIGSGPIVIGQAAEFDYAGTQACLALREEGYEVVLCNSNPATIMTDTTIADKIYMEPLNLEYIAKILRYERPDAIVPVPASGNYGGVYHPGDIDAIHNTGYIKIFRGAPVIEIPQSFTDENNTTTQIDPQMAYILPTGGEKVVKVVFEGATQINDFKNRDNSLEVYAYKKMGVAIMAHHNWAIYQNTGIAQTFVG